MATRSRIGIQLTDGSVLSAYHHWDSYPEWLGKTLKTHYNSRELATELIDGGSMSCCWTEDRWDDSADGSFGPQYYSQRGEDCPPRHDDTLKEYLSNGEEYAYIYTQDDEWVCYDLHGDLPEQVEIPSPLLHVG
jgi:hypothetical protein